MYLDDFSICDPAASKVSQQTVSQMRSVSNELGVQSAENRTLWRQGNKIFRNTDSFSCSDTVSLRAS